MKKMLAFPNSSEKFNWKIINLLFVCLIGIQKSFLCLIFAKHKQQKTRLVTSSKQTV